METSAMTYDRTALINELIERKAYRSYLEIGCSIGRNFNQITAELKVGVDPVCGGTLRMGSDKFFEVNLNTFDLIFIDGLHESGQVLRDVDNSMKVLNKNGVIVLHDCNPQNERQQTMPWNGQRIWCGDVWKAAVGIRTCPYVDMAVGNFDYGCGVILKRVNSLPLEKLGKPTIEDLRYPDLEMNRVGWLRLMDMQRLMEFIG